MATQVVNYNRNDETVVVVPKGYCDDWWQRCTRCIQQLISPTIGKNEATADECSNADTASATNDPNNNSSSSSSSSRSNSSTMSHLINQLELELSGELVNDPLGGKRMPRVELQKQSNFAVFYDDNEEDEDCSWLRPVPPILELSSERNRNHRTRYLTAPADRIMLMEGSVPGDTNDEMLYPASQDPDLMFHHCALAVPSTSFSFSDDDDGEDDDDNGASVYYCYRYNTGLGILVQI